MRMQGFGAVLALGVALVFGGTAEAQEKTKIRIGTHVSIRAHLFMQKKPELMKGLGKTYEVEWVRFAGSGDATPALVAGKLDAALATPFPMTNALFQSKVPVFFGHGSLDTAIPVESQEAFFRSIAAKAPGYPVRFVRFETGSHGTPIRMTDWRAEINWMLAQSR